MGKGDKKPKKAKLQWGLTVKKDHTQRRKKLKQQLRQLPKSNFREMPATR